MCCAYVEGEIGAVEGEYPGAVEGTWVISYSLCVIGCAVMRIVGGFGEWLCW